MTPQEEIALAVLSTSDGAPWTPVQVQKIFFLLDEKIPQEIRGPIWSFTPYDYGPFDSTVYRTIEGMQPQGLTATDYSGQMRLYRLTPEGQAEGIQRLSTLSPAAQDYVKRLSAWVRSLTFAQLVKAVYEEFPKMKERSVFQG